MAIFLDSENKINCCNPGSHRGKRSSIIIYMDNCCVFATAHIHGMTYKKRVFLTARAKDIIDKEETLALLDAIWLPL